MSTSFNWELPTLATLKKYPALTVGYVIFTFLLLVADAATSGALSRTFALYPGAPLKFDLNRLSFYLLYHNGLFHWAFNMVALFTPMARFETTHGTIYTGITLNLITILAGLQYCIVGLFLYPNEYVVGSSGVVFTFYTYYSYKEHLLNPILHTLKFQGREIQIPTLYSPFLLLVVCAIFMPQSSIWGHLAGISTGYILVLGYMKVLYPPSKVALYIERKLSTGITHLGELVRYYRELELVDVRGQTYTSIFDEDTVTTTTESTPFRGEGHQLGV